MRFYPNIRVNVIGALFVCLTLRLSYWQYERYEAKKIQIKVLEDRLNAPAVEITTLLNESVSSFENLPFRRVVVHGSYDFSKEMVIRNRRHEEIPGVFVLTPLLIDGTDKHILVNRGFAPLQYSEPAEREKLIRDNPISFIGLIKETVPTKFLAPGDPEAGPGLPWVDAWLRIDIENIKKQIPYPLLPVSLEIMSTDTTADTKAAIIQGKSGRDDMFFPSDRMYNMVSSPSTEPPDHFPIPVFDTVVPPGRNFGYIFEWAVMALGTILICFILQLRPSQNPARNT